MTQTSVRIRSPDASRRSAANDRVAAPGISPPAAVASSDFAAVRRFIAKLVMATSQTG